MNLFTFIISVLTNFQLSNQMELSQLANHSYKELLVEIENKNKRIYELQLTTNALQ